MDERNSKVKEQIIYEGGSTIELRCVVSNLVGDQPEYIIWKKDDRMLNYDLERGGIRYPINPTSVRSSGNNHSFTEIRWKLVLRIFSC